MRWLVALLLCLPFAAAAQTGVLSGGSVTAAGTTTARTLAARFGDVINALDDGADPTGATDASAAINAALAADSNGVFHNVYLPAGIYKLKNPITITGTRNGHGVLTGQCLFSDNKTQAVLFVDYDYNPSAGAPVTMTGNAQSTPCLENISIQFDQPGTIGSRSNFATLAAGCGNNGKGCQYPPAIDMSTAFNARLQDVWIGSAWDCVRAYWTGSEGLNEIYNVECGAFDRGLDLANSTGIVDVVNYHFYPWGISSANNTAIYQDGGTYAAYLNSMQGLTATNFFSQGGRVLITGAAQPTFSIFNNLEMDYDNATLEVNSSSVSVTVTGGYSDGAATGSDTACEMQATAGTLAVSTHWFRNTTDSAVPILCVGSGADLLVSNSHIAVGGTGTSAVSQTGGTLTLTGNQIEVQTASAWTVPLINVTSGSYRITGNNIGALGGSGIAISATDDATSAVLDNTFGSSWTYTPGGAQGSFVGTAWQTWNVSAGCSSGSLGSYTATGYFQRVGKQMQVHASLSITSLGTCAGGIGLNLPASGNGSIQANSAGRDNTSGAALITFVQGGSFWFQKYDGTFPAVAGHAYSLSANYVLP